MCSSEGTVYIFQILSVFRLSLTQQQFCQPAASFTLGVLERVARLDTGAHGRFFLLDRDYKNGG